MRQSPVVQIGRSARKVETALNHILEEEEVTLFEALLLTALFFEKKGVKPSALAEVFETTRGNVSHGVSSLEAKGLVKRRVDPGDARALQIMLLPQGRRRAVRVAGILDRMQRQLEQMAGVKEIQTMIRQLDLMELYCGAMAHADWPK
ncbi:MAG TPA: MarR family winged helix-turn-helix transcriptional regulator [Granulicella sp.]